MYVIYIESAVNTEYVDTFKCFGVILYYSANALSQYAIVNYNENENENLPLLQNIILLVCDSLSGQSCLFMLAIYLFNHLLDFIFKFTGILGYNELQEVQAK